MRDLRKFTGRFTSIVEMKIKMIWEFKEQVPATLNFSVGRQSSKKCPEDLIAMYATFEQSGKTDICLWCDGVGEENESGTSRKRNLPQSVQKRRKKSMTSL